jgi:hypothetical protein
MWIGGMGFGGGSVGVVVLGTRFWGWLLGNGNGSDGNG